MFRDRANGSCKRALPEHVLELGRGTNSFRIEGQRQQEIRAVSNQNGSGYVGVGELVPNSGGFLPSSGEENLRQATRPMAHGGALNKKDFKYGGTAIKKTILHWVSNQMPDQAFDFQPSSIITLLQYTN
eukprot:g37939.t1